jgi:hypothetical protein
MNHDYKLVEKKNHLHCHGLFLSRESAEKHLREVVPMYCNRGYYMDKTLTPDSFEVIGPDSKSAQPANKI